METPSTANASQMATRRRPRRVPPEVEVDMLVPAFLSRFHAADTSGFAPNVGISEEILNPCRRMLTHVR
jgi:hypothetical protein